MAGFDFQTQPKFPLAALKVPLSCLRDSPLNVSPFVVLTGLAFVLGPALSFGFFCLFWALLVVAEIALISPPAPARMGLGALGFWPQNYHYCGRPTTDGIGLIAARRGSGCGWRSDVRCVFSSVRVKCPSQPSQHRRNPFPAPRGAQASLAAFFCGLPVVGPRLAM